jgi:hypothetical protein
LLAQEDLFIGTIFTAFSIFSTVIQYRINGSTPFCASNAYKTKQSNFNYLQNNFNKFSAVYLFFYRCIKPSKLDLGYL